jgi:hypothetical protein
MFLLFEEPPHHWFLNTNDLSNLRRYVKGEGRNNYYITFSFIELP